VFAASMPSRHLALTTAAAIAGLALVPSAAHGQSRFSVRVGIGDQQETMFANPHFQALKVRRVRYFIPWNAMRNTEQRLAARRYVLAARRQNIQVLMHVHTSDLRHRRGSLPAVKTYRRDVGRLVRYFRKLGVREWGVWNEANHKSQPTWNNPRRAAQYFTTMRSICRGCTIVALDVLDQRGVERYIARFYAALSPAQRRNARIVGIHNYSDVNRRRTRGTRAIMNTVRKRNRNTRARFWLTETGGLVRFSSAFPYNLTRARNRTTFMFQMARNHRARIDRLYIYNWTGLPRGAHFDAGLTDEHGQPRPAYHVVRSQMRRFLR
jgi:hypothetical protein